MESDRSFGEAYANIGALRWAGGNKEEALKLFERAFILSPDRWGHCHKLLHGRGLSLEIA